MDKKRFAAFVVSDKKGGEEKSPMRVDNTLSNGAGRTALPPRLASRDTEAGRGGYILDAD